MKEKIVAQPETMDDKSRTIVRRAGRALIDASDAIRNLGRESMALAIRTDAALAQAFHPSSVGSNWDKFMGACREVGTILTIMASDRKHAHEVCESCGAELVCPNCKEEDDDGK